jgi:hypothetical protein
VISKVFRDRRKAAKAAASPITHESVYWPADILPRDFEEARVLTYGYDSHVSRFFKGAANQNNISAHGRSLLNTLELHRRADPQRPLIFMVHSLGGIILKEVRGVGELRPAKIAARDFPNISIGPPPLEKFTRRRPRPAECL